MSLTLSHQPDLGKGPRPHSIPQPTLPDLPGEGKSSAQPGEGTCQTSLSCDTWSLGCWRTVASCSHLPDGLGSVAGQVQAGRRWPQCWGPGAKPQDTSRHLAQWLQLVSRGWGREELTEGHSGVSLGSLVLRGVRHPQPGLRAARVNKVRAVTREH